jgi:hypothetical protein
MLDEGKTLRDSKGRTDISVSDNLGLSLSYTKTNKLVTALYMVTDMMDVAEPLRTKLRFLGAEIISDINSVNAQPRLYVVLYNKVGELVSFLDIASTVGMISEMNKNILKKEFMELQNSVKSVESLNNFYGGHSSVEEFLNTSKTFTVMNPVMDTHSPIGHNAPTRIGVQKGHTLMKALSDRMPSLSDKQNGQKDREKFDSLKAERRKEILSAIKENGGVSTITDIKSKAKGVLASCGEKTLQRELFSMVGDGVLYKTGEKRWSRYSIK